MFEAAAQGQERRAIPAAAREASWAAKDGTELRRIDWEQPAAEARGSILFFPGRGDNYEKYLETLGQWHEAGWYVTAADWRGQAGSGRLGNDQVTGHVPDFSLWVDDLAHFWAQWKAATPGPHILAGHSMGAHIALRAAIERRVDPDGLLLCAPMLGFVGNIPIAIGQAMARLMCWLGDPARPAWKWSEKPGEVPASRQALLTHDDERYADELWWREKRPQLVMGPGSWGWVERAYASMRRIFAGSGLEKLRIPVLILATSNDRLVSIRAIEQAAARLPNAQLIRFGHEARHEILREEDAVRDRAMKATFAFLERISGQQ